MDIIAKYILAVLFAGWTAAANAGLVTFNFEFGPGLDRGVSAGMLGICLLAIRRRIGSVRL